MATIETIRPDLGRPDLGKPEAGSPRAMTESPLELAAFRQGRGDAERMTDLLAFGLAAERQEPATPEAIARLRQEATAALSDFSFRYLHNTVEQVRRDAVTEHLGRLRPPPGFLRLVLANLVAMALAAAAGWWLMLHPETLAGISGLLAG
jgi:hypothetical protein